MSKAKWIWLVLLVAAGGAFYVWKYTACCSAPESDAMVDDSAVESRIATSLTKQEVDAFNEDADGWIGIETYQNWKDAVFPISEYDGIPPNYKRGMIKVFIDNKYIDGDSDSEVWRLTRIKDRAPNVYAFGNFTGRADGNDANRDIAYILESADFSDSQLFVQSSRGDLLFYKKYSGSLPTVSSFRKGAKIFIDNTELEPAPEDGMIIKDSDRKFVVMYDRKTKTFKQYHQYTNAEIDEMNNPETIECDEESGEGCG